MRTIAICLCLCLLLALIPAAQAAEVSDVMCVTNCQEWVSLREAPNTSSSRVAKVRLGELVTHCKAANDTFIECMFGDKLGYIQSKYLKTTTFSSDESFPGNQMVVNISEWASLWEQPDSSSNRLAKVPVGTIVTACVNVTPEFTYCEYKSGKTVLHGYISRTYLKNANYSASTPSSKVQPMDGTVINGISMTVTNCEEWVSLREKASANGARLAKVPLGTQVEECVQVSDEFVYCRYNGLYGYIYLQYLALPEDMVPEDPNTPPTDTQSAFSSLPELPDYQTLSKTGTKVMSATFQGYTIMVRKAYSEYEEMLAVCYDLENRPLWRLHAYSTSELSDVIQLDAFTAGLTEDPRLIWYVSGVGFYAYGYGPTAELKWFLPNEPALDILNSIVYQTDYVDGSFYVAFEDVLMRISADGELLWRTKCNDSGLFWPVKIEIEETGVNVVYDNHFGIIDVYDVARFTPGGTLLGLSQRPSSQ